MTNRQTGELTGYPSIDKPWLKYYSEEAINTPVPECSIYEYMLENNKDLVICRENLPEYMVPEEISFVEEMPRTPRGKIDYRALEELG